MRLILREKERHKLETQARRLTDELNLSGKTGARAKMVGLATSSWSHLSPTKMRMRQRKGRRQIRLFPLYKLTASNATWIITLARPHGLKEYSKEKKEEILAL